MQRRLRFLFGRVMLALMPTLHPTPDAQGIAQTQEFYQSQYGRTLTEAEAAQALGAVMRFLYFSRPEISPSETFPPTATPL